MAQKKEHVQTHYLPTESYLATRAAALHFPAKQFADMINDQNSVYGIVIDMPIKPHYPVHTGGIHQRCGKRLLQQRRLLHRCFPAVSDRGTGRTALVANAPRILGECSQTTSFPLPTSQPHHLYLLTKKGIFEKKVLPSAIKEESEDMQAIYFLYQQVMRELRSAQLKDQAMSQK